MSKLDVQCLVGVRVTKLMTPADAVRPPSVDCGPLSTSTRLMSCNSLAAVESDGTGTPSIRMDTPEVRPTACSFALVEMPRIASGTRPLYEPLSSTDGTSLLMSEMSVALDFSSSWSDTTEAATGVSFSRSVRFCALITTSCGASSLRGVALAAAAGAAACASACPLVAPRAASTAACRGVQRARAILLFVMSSPVGSWRPLDVSGQRRAGDNVETSSFVRPIVCGDGPHQQPRCAG